MADERPADDGRFDEARRRLLEMIEAEAKETESWTGRAKLSPRVMAVLAKVPRHAFVAPGDEPFAYDNRPLTIGHGQTISQPFIVAVMTDLLDLKNSDRVLEIGTGCGYQAAVLAEVAGRVFTIEVVGDLAEAARQRLQRLGYDNVEVRSGDGYDGWPDEAPFDAIMVTAAPKKVPEALIDQLAPGGRLVVPIGLPHSTQALNIGVKGDDGKVTYRNVLPVAFVPMVKGKKRRS